MASVIKNPNDWQHSLRFRGGGGPQDTHLDLTAGALMAHQSMIRNGRGLLFFILPKKPPEKCRCEVFGKVVAEGLHRWLAIARERAMDHIIQERCDHLHDELDINPVYATNVPLDVRKQFGLPQRIACKMYTLESVKNRIKLRNDRILIAAIERFWKRMPKTNTNGLDRYIYDWFTRKVYNQLVPRESAAYVRWLQERTRRLDEDWRQDSEGQAELTHPLFEQAMFNLLDLWTESTELKEYVELLEQLYEMVFDKDKFEIPSENHKNLYKLFAPEEEMSLRITLDEGRYLQRAPSIPTNDQIDERELGFLHSSLRKPSNVDDDSEFDYVFGNSTGGAGSGAQKRLGTDPTLTKHQQSSAVTFKDRSNSASDPNNIALRIKVGDESQTVNLGETVVFTVSALKRHDLMLENARTLSSRSLQVSRSMVEVGGTWVEQCLLVTSETQLPALEVVLTIVIRSRKSPKMLSRCFSSKELFNRLAKSASCAALLPRSGVAMSSSMEKLNAILKKDANIPELSLDSSAPTSEGTSRSNQTASTNSTVGFVEPSSSSFSISSAARPQLIPAHVVLAPDALLPASGSSSSAVLAMTQALRDTKKSSPVSPGTPDSPADTKETKLRASPAKPKMRKAQSEDSGLSLEGKSIKNKVTSTKMGPNGRASPTRRAGSRTSTPNPDLQIRPSLSPNSSSSSLNFMKCASQNSMSSILAAENRDRPGTPDLLRAKVTSASPTLRNSTSPPAGSASSSPSVRPKLQPSRTLQILTSPPMSPTPQGENSPAGGFNPHSPGRIFSRLRNASESKFPLSPPSTTESDGPSLATTGKIDVKPGQDGIEKAVFPSTLSPPLPPRPRSPMLLRRNNESDSLLSDLVLLDDRSSFTPPGGPLEGPASPLVASPVDDSMDRGLIDKLRRRRRAHEGGAAVSGEPIVESEPHESLENNNTYPHKGQATPTSPLSPLNIPLLDLDFVGISVFAGGPLDGSHP